VKSVLDAAGEPLKLAVAEKPTVVKVNRDELTKLFGQKVPLRAAGSAGASAAVMTLGGEGASVWDGKNIFRIRVPKVRVISPIGSGDSFAAGIAAGLVRGLATPQAAKLGAACGVANTLTAVPGFVEKTQVEELLNQIELKCE
jgi:tagatose 6-phosphate kinase